MSNNPTPLTDATMAEKEQVLRNDARVRSGSTFRDHTHSEEGGRYAKPTNVIGSTLAPEYPAGPNWSVDPTGLEPPLGIDVNAIEPVGTEREIEASLGDGSPGVAQGDPNTENGLGITASQLGSPADLARATADASEDRPLCADGASSDKRLPRSRVVERPGQSPTPKRRE